jgi:hypothetical protein
MYDVTSICPPRYVCTCLFVLVRASVFVSRLKQCARVVCINTLMIRDPLRLTNAPPPLCVPLYCVKCPIIDNGRRVREREGILAACLH